MMPPPVVLLTVLMVGYPLVQILATGLRRKKRLQFNALSVEILADTGFSSDEKSVVHWIKTGSRGDLYTLTYPLTISALIFQHATMSKRAEPWTTDTKNHRKNNLAPKQGIWLDPRTKKLGELSIQLELLTYPLTTITTALFASATWILAALIMLLRGSLPKVPQIGDFFPISLNSGKIH